MVCVKMPESMWKVVISSLVHFCVCFLNVRHSSTCSWFARLNRLYIVTCRGRIFCFVETMFRICIIVLCVL